MEIGQRQRFDLSGKTALVTGGAGLLGRHIARGLVEQGAAVGIIDIDGERARSAADEISRDTGGTCRSFACDICEPDAVSSTVSEAETTLGPVQILFNNAATKSENMKDFFLPFEEFPLDVWREVMAVNIDGMFLMAQAVGRRMVEHGDGGSIIQTASIYGVVGPDKGIYEGSEHQGMAINTPAVYSTSKAAVLGLTRYLATYWADQRIRVNAITPGGVEDGQNAEFQRRYGKRAPLGRMAEVDEMIGAAVFLASDDSSYVTGHNLVVDGGWTAW